MLPAGQHACTPWLAAVWLWPIAPPPPPPPTKLILLSQTSLEFLLKCLSSTPPLKVAPEPRGAGYPLKARGAASGTEPDPAATHLSCLQCRNLELEESERLAVENIKDIVAVGFDEQLTFIFTDFNYLGGAFSRNINRIQR